MILGSSTPPRIFRILNPQSSQLVACVGGEMQKDWDSVGSSSQDPQSSGSFLFFFCMRRNAKRIGDPEDVNHSRILKILNPQSSVCFSNVWGVLLFCLFLPKMAPPKKGLVIDNKSSPPPQKTTAQKC